METTDEKNTGTGMDKNSITGFSPEAVIIDAGSFPTDSIPLGWLDNCRKIICCDGAANSYLRNNPGKVWRIVGDCDSLSPEIKREYASIIRLNPDQETNDQTKAVQYLVAKGISRIAIIAATGLREDHTLGNISLLMEYLKEGIHARAYTDFGVFIPSSGTQTFFCDKGTRVSIFNFSAKEMSATGLKYPIRAFTSLWQGTLNQTVSGSFTINADGDYLVYITYPGTK